MGRFPSFWDFILSLFYTGFPGLFTVLFRQVLLYINIRVEQILKPDFTKYIQVYESIF